MHPAPVLINVVVELVQKSRDLCLAQQLPLLVAGSAGHARNQRRGRCEVQRGKWQPRGIEIIERQGTVRLQHDRLSARFHRFGINPVGQSLLDDHRVVVIPFSLGQQVAHRHRLAGAAHSKKHRVLRRFLARGSRKGFDSDEVCVRAVVDRLGAGQVPGECGVHGKHVRKVLVFGVKLARPVASPEPSGPGLKEEFARRARQVAFKILRAVHRVDGALDRRRLRAQARLGFIPDPHDELCVEGKGMAVGQRRDLALLFLEDRAQRKFAFAREVACDALVRLLFPFDLPADRKGLHVHGDGVVQQRQIGEPVDDSREGDFRPAGDGDHRMVVSVHPETEVGLAAALAVPAVFVD